jgi:hypothetical protein
MSVIAQWKCRDCNEQSATKAPHYPIRAIVTRNDLNYDKGARSAGRGTYITVWRCLRSCSQAFLVQAERLCARGILEVSLVRVALLGQSFGSGGEGGY